MCRIAALVILLTALAAAGAEPRFSLGADYLYGDVSGYVQTPSGGEPGTTSTRRPSLDEIGIDSTAVYDAHATAGLGDDALYLGGQWIDMSGSATLHGTLKSQGQTFPAGAHVSSDVEFNWYRFGYCRDFHLGDGDWTLSPSIGAAVLDFHYRLTGGDARADRSYIKLNAQFGLETEWRPNKGRFALDLVLLGSVPVSPPLPEIYQEELLASYRVIDRANMNLDLIAGVAFEQLYYEDNQDTPNHIKAELGPMLVFGLDWHF